MKKVKYLMMLLLGVSITSCYDGYVNDYDYSSVGFAMAKPLRTVIADRNMDLRLGVSIGGKRAVDMNDWARFVVDTAAASMPAGKKMLPTAYYTLSDSVMRVRKSNLPVADIAISFKDTFYTDPLSLTGTYVLPLKITASSLDTIVLPSTVVAFKYISTFHGTYYVKDSVVLLASAGGTPTDTLFYENKDLVRNITRDLSTTGRYTLLRPGFANNTVVSTEKFQLKIVPTGSADKTYPIEVTSVAGATPITNGSGTYYGGKVQPEMRITYSYTSGGKFYRVIETLILRQDPLYDLRVESWL